MSEIDSWTVGLTFPDVEFNALADWILGFVMAQAGGPSGTGTLINQGMSWLYGGTLVPGKLTLKTDGLHFDVNRFAASVYYKNAPQHFFIPLSDISSARASASFLGVSANPMMVPRAILQTVKGQLTIVSQFSSKSIARKINALLI